MTAMGIKSIVVNENDRSLTIRMLDGFTLIVGEGEPKQHQGDDGTCYIEHEWGDAQAGGMTAADFDALREFN